MIRATAICLAIAALTVTGTVPKKRLLESITVSPSQAKGAKAAYVATGKFNEPPVKVEPLHVSWYLAGPGIDPPPPYYSLTTAADKPDRCNEIAANPVEFHYTVIALAPADPKASRSGPVPRKVFQDLVIDHSKTSEGGFVVGFAKLACP
jgi:hypothetical protein